MKRTEYMNDNDIETILEADRQARNVSAEVVRHMTKLTTKAK